MIEVHKTESDDPEFLKLVANLLHGLAVGGAPRELHLIHIDNWFDHKWLGFSGKALGALGVWKDGQRLTVPAFTPNRVLSHQYFSLSNAGSTLHETPPPTEIHLKIWSAVNLQRRISEVSHHAALVWYSGNTRTNRKGAVMAYVPTESDYRTWYASLAAGTAWRIEKTKGITKADFESLTASVPQGDVQQDDAAGAVSPRR